MLNRYSSNQQVDRGLTYHLVFKACMCQATISISCFTCRSPSGSSSGSVRIAKSRCDTCTSDALPSLNLFLCDLWLPLPSVVAMCIVIMMTHISMHVNNVRMADVMAGVSSECGLSACCRGMLAASPHGNTSGAVGEDTGRAGGDHMSRASFPEGIDNKGMAGGARPSRTQGRGSRGGRRLDGESSSESE
jgi:hypothetical protein